MSLTTQSYNYALNNIDELTKFIQNRVTNTINNTYNNFNENTTFVIFTMFAKGFFTTHLLPESEFQDGVLVNPYAPNITVLATASGKAINHDYDLVKKWFVCELTQGLTKTQTLDENADSVGSNKNTSIIGITEYDMHIPLKSFLVKTGQDVNTVRTRLVEHLNITSKKASLIQDIVNNYYDQIMDRPLHVFLNDKNHGLSVLNNVTERVTYIIHQ